MYATYKLENRKELKTDGYIFANNDNDYILFDHWFNCIFDSRKLF